MSLTDSIVVSVVSTLLTTAIVLPSTAWISLRRYRFVKWWDRKAEAYTSILTSLSQLYEFYFRSLEEIMTHEAMSDDRKELVIKLSSDARRDLGNATRIGSFLVSDRAAELLSAFEINITSSGGNEDWFGYIENGLATVMQMLSDMQDEARVDLGLSSQSLPQLARGFFSSTASVWQKVKSVGPSGRP